MLCEVQIGTDIVEDCAASKARQISQRVEDTSCISNSKCPFMGLGRCHSAGWRWRVMILFENRKEFPSKITQEMMRDWGEEMRFIRRKKLFFCSFMQWYGHSTKEGANSLEGLSRKERCVKGNS